MDCPTIYTLSLPENERAVVDHLASSLRSLDSRVGDFKHALRLFDFAGFNLQETKKISSTGLSTEARKARTEKQDILKAWSQIACRDGAMTIFHFHRTIDEIRDTIFETLPTLRDMIDRQKMKSMERMRESFFSRFVAIRNAVGHDAELVTTPEKFALNAQKSGNLKTEAFDIEGVENLYIAGAITGRTYTVTIGGNILNYDVSAETVSRLEAVKNEFYSAFNNVEAATLAGHRRVREEQIARSQAERLSSKD